jgi:hypothetical protein
MAKVAAYHTTSPEYPPTHRNVYHDHDDCHDGKSIKPKDRVSGTAASGLDNPLGYLRSVIPSPSTEMWKGFFLPQAN